MMTNVTEPAAVRSARNMGRIELSASGRFGVQMEREQAFNLKLGLDRMIDGVITAYHGGDYTIVKQVDGGAFVTLSSSYFRLTVEFWISTADLRAFRDELAGALE